MKRHLDWLRRLTGSIFPTAKTRIEAGAKSLPTPSHSWQQWAEEPYPTTSREEGPHLEAQLRPVFQCDQLDETADSTRLLEIKPHLRMDGLLDCSLVSVKFGDRPKFEALSYMWGDDDVRKKICINGAEFEVNENLFDALHFLRRRPDPHRWLPIWIDAICIDQGGTAEKDRQLPFMPQIYERAQQVLVWLGRDYERFQEPSTEDFIRRELHRRHGRLDDGEIGKARQIKVCFGKITLNWAEFFCLASRFGDADCGPTELNLMNRSRESRKLKDLLERYKHAECALPKDKVYGLLGLALDSAGFTAHYDQSDLRTWVDTLDFAVRRHLVVRDGIISFARMVKTLVFDHPKTQPPDLSELEKNANSEDTGHSASAYPMRAVLLGSVKSIGPSTTEVISNLGAINEWQSNHDRLRRSLLDIDDDAIESMLSSSAADTLSSSQHIILTGDLVISHLPDPSFFTCGLDTSQSSFPARLFELDQSKAGRLWSTYDNSNLGIISSRARPGDVLCYLIELREILVFRIEGVWPKAVRTVGKGLLTRGILASKPYEYDRGKFDGLGGIFVKVTAKTLWQLAS